MLPSDAPFLETALALLALPFRPVTAGVLLLPALLPEARPMRHARRTSNYHRQRRWLEIMPQDGALFNGDYSFS